LAVIRAGFCWEQNDEENPKRVARYKKLIFKKDITVTSGGFEVL